MKVKEKVIRRSIEEINKRLSEVNYILEANPLGDIMKLRTEAQKELEKARKNNTDTSDEFLEYIKKASKKEKELFALAEKQQNTSNLVSEKVELESELSSLNNELWYIENRDKF